MEGPTPVSALIHAATMVTAGVFLIIRCSYIFEFSAVILDLTKYFGVITIVSFGLVAIFQYDIKKIIAYSTCSQLGYMILCCGLSGYSIALFHLFTHASFKALLFLSAGTIIHTFNNEQDLRKINAISNILPLVSVSFIIGSLAIVGIPFFAGFFSKEPILLLSFLYKQNIQIYYFAIFGVCLTTIYSLKILYYIFFKSNTSFKFNYKQNRNLIDYNNIVVITILSILSIIVGYIFKTWFIDIGNNNFYGVIFSYNKYFILHKFEFVNFLVKSIPLFLIVSITLIFMYFIKNNNIIKLPYNLILFFTKKLFFDSLMNIFGF
jgi:NADH:ubiquinone oxidoreductase subunit 5 (subunit L)/multisubunit Na+/H+ antiporter MnhA subunit